MRNVCATFHYRLVLKVSSNWLAITVMNIYNMLFCNKTKLRNVHQRDNDQATIKYRSLNPKYILLNYWLKGIELSRD